MKSNRRAAAPAPQDSPAPQLEFHPVTPDRWADLERLFGGRNSCAGCWCMWLRIARSDFRVNGAEGNRLAMKALVDSGQVPGILAYENDEPIGWCSIAPRETYSALERSRVRARIDDQPVWSAACFFVARGHRRQGVTVRLLRAAAEYARENGATMVEGYPVVPRQDGVAPAAIWPGLANTFSRAGFTIAAQPSPTRLIMRLDLTEVEGQN